MIPVLVYKEGKVDPPPPPKPPMDYGEYGDALTKLVEMAYYPLPLVRAPTEEECREQAAKDARAAEENARLDAALRARAERLTDLAILELDVLMGEEGMEQQDNGEGEESAIVGANGGIFINGGNGEKYGKYGVIDISEDSDDDVVEVIDLCGDDNDD